MYKTLRPNSTKIIIKFLNTTESREKCSECDIFYSDFIPTFVLGLEKLCKFSAALSSIEFQPSPSIRKANNPNLVRFNKSANKT